MASEILSAGRVRELLDYDPITGYFTHKIKRSGVSCGSIAGSPSGTGYTYINVDGKKYGAHRLAFLHVSGQFPPMHVDHINGIRSDNRFDNLRHADIVLNNQNRRHIRADNSSGFMGVSKKGRKWRARIVADNHETSLGVFHTKDAAYASYLTAKRNLHKGCTL